MKGRALSKVWLLVISVTLVAGLVLLLPDWTGTTRLDARAWNGLVAFAALGVLCEMSFLRLPFANVGSSVAFVPFLASAVLFPHPWPMAIAGLTAATVDSAIRRKPPIRMWFNAVQYMLAVGAGGVVYSVLGGRVSLTSFFFAPAPFVGLVVTFFLLNTASVTAAVSLSSGVSPAESWRRLVGGSLVYDFFSSSVAVLLVFLYVKMQLLGLALLIVPLFFVRHMYHMNLQLERVNRELLELMVKAIEARDPYTSGHSVRVSKYARTIARDFGLPPRQVDQIATAALLHDVGKIYEEFAPVLRKEGRLTSEERVLMQGHPVRSAELVGTIGEFRGAVQAAIRNHHENYDGSGYPDGLVGDDIPIAARIIMIADTIDAMTTDRPYRQALSYQTVLNELACHSGTQFDPRLVRLVLNSVAMRHLIGGDGSESGLLDRRGLPPTTARPRAARIV